MKKTHKGKLVGRPTVLNKRNIPVSVMVNEQELAMLKTKAEQTNKFLSVYLREMGLNGSIHVKAVNRDFLGFLNTLQNTGSLLNQIARKRNSFQDLDALERATLNVLAADIAKLTDEIRKSIK